MDFPDASRFAGGRDVVLVGYRGIDGSSMLDCPEVESARKHARDLLGSGLPRASRRLHDVRAPPPAGRRRPRRLHAARTRRRPRSGPACARLPAGRPPQRERRNAHGDDLRLALSEPRPSLGDDRRQPARRLPLGRRDDRRADPQVRGALRAELRAAAARPTSRPRSARRVAHLPGTSGSCRSRRATSRPAPSSACSTRRGRRPADRGAEDDRHAAVGPARRRRAAPGSCR